MPESRPIPPTELPHLRSVERAIGMYLLFPPKEFRSRLPIPEPTPEAYAAARTAYTGGLALITSVRRQFGVPGSEPFTPTREQRRWLRDERGSPVKELQDVLRAAGPVFAGSRVPYARTPAALLAIVTPPASRLRREHPMRLRHILSAVDPVYFTFRARPTTEQGNLYIGSDDVTRILSIAAAMDPQTIHAEHPSFYNSAVELAARNASPMRSLATLALHTGYSPEALASRLLNDGIYGYHYPDAQGVNQMTYQVSDLPWYASEAIPR